MARLQRPYMAVTEFVTPELGASDATTVMNTVGCVVPEAGARIARVTATTHTVGATTGTFTIQILAGATALTAAGITIDADGAEGVVHGQMAGNGVAVPTHGTKLGIATVKTGTVSTGAILHITIVWTM